MAVVIKKKSLLAGIRPVPQAEKPAIENVVCGFNPMLAGEAVLGQVPYPMVALPKHNGVRGGNQVGSLLARSLKPIANRHTYRLFSGMDKVNLEGELVVGDPFDDDVFAVSTSGVRSVSGEPDVNWFIFDWYHPDMPFIERLKVRDTIVTSLNHPRIHAIPYHIINSDEELVALSDHYLAMKFEGLVLRRPDGLYKTGRSTDAEAGFLRYVPWQRSEALILEIIEGYVNQNESVKNELGYLKKSSSKDGKVGSGRAGSVLVKDLKTGKKFNISVPSVALQEDVWDHPMKYLRQPLKYKFKAPVKRGGAPRFPQWEGMRAPEDM